MAIFIHSDDFKSGGSSSNGEWTIGRNMKGNWAITTQQMDDQTFPWLWDGVNTMVMEIHNPENLLESTVFEIEFPPSIGLLTDVTDIANNLAATMQARIDEIKIDDAWADRTVEVAAGDGEIVFDFGEDRVDILWQGYDVYVSTVNVPFGRTSTSANQLAIQFLTVSSTNMITDPKYLEVYIAESNTQYATSHGTKPNLLFSTRDGQFTAQSFSIPRDTNSLNIQVKRMSHSYELPLSGRWYLSFENSA